MAPGGSDYCGTLGERFTFFHVAPLAGFKGGALNSWSAPHGRRMSKWWR